MFSVASLLNPIRKEHKDIQSLSSSPNSRLRKSPSSRSLPTLKKQRLKKYQMIPPKAKVKGDVCFPPYENLDEQVAQEVRKFQIYPLGKIKEYSRHIPYNSGKKSFLEKTGRESFEVFQYIFKIPGEDKDYTVMWDYNIGLVRITPFFKCCKYTKTTPAKMLAQNPGLREITHSITGGALVAQGYWMPFNCAREICATFCHHIAPALIPLFGPSFPSICIHSQTPEYGRMIISEKTIVEAKFQAEAFRYHYNLVSAEKIATSPTPSNVDHFNLIQKTSNDRDLKTKFLNLQQTNACQRGDLLSSSHYLSPEKSPAEKSCNVKHFDQIWNTESAVLPRCSPPKRSYHIFTDISNLHITPEINSRGLIEINDTRALKRRAFTETNSEKNSDYKMSTRKCLFTNINLSTETDLRSSEYKPELSNRSEEAKAAYSLINLSLKHWKVSYEDADCGTELHLKRRRATST